MDRLFFTRCAKVGSESLMEFMEHLQDINHFRVDKYGVQKKSQRQLKPLAQALTAGYVYNMDEGSVYVEHIPWIDFNEYNLPKPIFINLVRDPVERMISWYYYVRNSYRNAIFYRNNPLAPLKPTAWFKKSYNDCVRSGDPECQYVPLAVRDVEGNFKRQSIFFCGHDQDCLPFNSPLAIQIAMRRVESEYAVVGTWEETNITLTVLEHYIPRYFARAKMIFHMYQKSLQNRNRNNRKPHVDEDVRAMVRRNFTHEYDFYYFCKQRLYTQPFESKHAIQLAKLNVERDYAVVGTWEETNITLAVLEAYIPRFFKGARTIFELNSHSIRNRNRNHRKPHIDPDVREMVKRNFTNEYEFYHFCKQRLYKQYLALQLENNLH